MAVALPDLKAAIVAWRFWKVTTVWTYLLSLALAVATGNFVAGAVIVNLAVESVTTQLLG